MAHEEQNDPVAQSSMYQRRPPNLVASTADLSERDIKENPVVKEEETNDTEVFEEVVVEVARLSKEPKSSISPPPGSSMPYLNAPRGVPFRKIQFGNERGGRSVLSRLPELRIARILALLRQFLIEAET